MSVLARLAYENSTITVAAPAAAAVSATNHDNGPFVSELRAVAKPPKTPNSAKPAGITR